MSLCGERFVSSLGRSYTTPFPVSGKHYDQVYRASILTLTELKSQQTNHIAIVHKAILARGADHETASKT
ncbi:hypothetical protein ECLT68_1727 [Escherichia coli LT-68]|nr:hypothetical protein ECLT68_1727 [Escherichia coli LT-68]